MTNIDAAHNRKVAAWLADALAPMLPNMPRPRTERVVSAEVCAATEKVCAAVDRLQQARFTPEERPSRLALERAARDLRDCMRRRSSSNPQKSKQEKENG